MASLHKYNSQYNNIKREAKRRPELFGKYAYKAITRKPDDRFEFRPEIPQRVCKFIECLPDIGTRDKRIILLDYQVFIIYELFG